MKAEEVHRHPGGTRSAFKDGSIAGDADDLPGALEPRRANNLRNLSLNSTNPLQEIFDRVAAHLLTQREQATGDGTANRCVLRSKDGKKCAVGCLIKDEHYTPDAEGSPVDAILFPTHDGVAALRTALEKSDVIVSSGSVALMSRLQFIHDMGHVPRWSAELRKAAKRWQLSPDILDKFE